MAVRYWISVLTSIQLAMVLALNVNLNIVIVKMVNYTAISETEKMTDDMEDGPFNWNSRTQGIILSSYYWGNTISQFPGGRLAEMFSARWMMFAAIFINTICTGLTPIAAKWHYGALEFFRALEGLGAGGLFPSVQVLLAYWAPPLERNMMASIMLSGASFGIVISYLISGMIAQYINWESVFYIEAGVGAVWIIIWWCYVFDTPNDCKYISDDEKRFINSSLRTSTTDVSPMGMKKHYGVPWLKAFKSTPFLAILVAHTTSGWAWYTLVIETPQYMKTILHFDIKSNALFTALPFLFRGVFALIFGEIVLRLRKSGKLSSTMARKLGTSTGNLTVTLCLTVLCIIHSEQRWVAVAMIFVGIGFTGAYSSGHVSNHVDLAPNFAGTLMGITSTWATVTGMVVPLYCGILLHKNNSIYTWKIIYGTAIIVSIFGMTTYLIFASGELQAWNEPPSPPPQSSLESDLQLQSSAPQTSAMETQSRKKF